MMRTQARSCAGDCRNRATVLLVDDNRGTLETTSALLRHPAFDVHAAASGEEALHAARRERLDLALIDLRLPDMSGLDIARTLRAEQINVPWILTSGFLDFDVATEAGRLGALRAVASPFNVDEVVTRALAEVRNSRPHGWPDPPLTSRLRDPKSAAERCAWLILRGCDADEDPNRLHDWASVAVIGYSTLRRACDVVHVQPHDARDFMRILRVLMRSDGRVESLEAHLKFCDPGTLAALLDRAGRPARGGHYALTLEDYLATQRFIAAGHPVLAAIRALVGAP